MKNMKVGEKQIEFRKNFIEDLKKKISYDEALMSFAIATLELTQKDKYYKALQDIKEYIESNLINHCNNDFLNDIKDIVNKALGGKK